MNNLNSCSINMSLLKSAPFNLNDGQRLNARVIASNKCGTSPPSLPHGNTVILNSIPTIPNKPVAQLNGKSMQICWNQGLQDMGSTSPANKYELFWGMGERPAGSISALASMNNVERTTETCFTHNSI
jgi:hypothetical protein